MKNKILHIVLFILTLEGYAQPLTSWNYTPTNSMHKINFQNTILRIDGIVQTRSDSDAVAVFTLQNGSYASAGFGKFNQGQGQDTISFIAYLDPAIVNPPYKFFYWNSIRGCQIEVKDSSGIKLTPSESSVIRSMSGNTPFLQYPKSIFTTKDTSTFINFSGASFPVTYSTSNSNLVLDTNTGLISLSRSLPGNYTIKFNSKFCLKNDSFQITILRVSSDTLKIDLSNLITDILPATCEHEGSVFLKGIKGKQPFTYNLTNNSDNSFLTNTSGVFNEVKEGVYTLSVSDSAGNTAKYPSTINIQKAGDCANTVLRPDGKDGIQSLYIPDVGQAKILNRNGDVIKLLSIPAEWNCDDAQGKPVPMGDYYLFINETQSKVITVLR